MTETAMIAAALGVIAAAQVTRVVLSVVRLVEWRKAEDSRLAAVDQITQAQARLAHSFSHTAGAIADAAEYRQ